MLSKSVKKERVEYERFGWAMLGKKATVEAVDAPFAPLKVYYPSEDGSKPDYSKASLLIKRQDLNDLLVGKEWKIPVVISPPFVPVKQKA